jgi:hypothetical protein
MDAQKGTWSQGYSTVIEGNHHIIAGGKLAAGLTALAEGTLLKETAPGGGTWTPAAAGDVAAATGLAVLVEPVVDTNATDAAAGLVHGVTRLSKLVYANGDSLDGTGRAALRRFGIYAI